MSTKEDIAFVFLPENCTQLLLPIDMEFFAPTKQIWRTNPWRIQDAKPCQNSIQKETFFMFLWDELAKDDNQPSKWVHIMVTESIEKNNNWQSNDEICDAVGDSIITSLNKKAVCYYCYCIM